MGVTNKQRGKQVFAGGSLEPGYGAKNGSTISVAEFGGIVRKTIFTMTALPLTLADATVGAGVKIYDFPEGRLLFLGAVGAFAFTTTSTLASTLNAGVTINWGIGSTTQANGTLATTEQDILPTTNATASATINVAGATSKGKNTAVLFLDGTTTAIDAFFNVGVATATDIDADATITISGVLTLHWMNLGDY